MKKYALSHIIILIVTFTVVFFVSFFFYTRISDRHLEQKISVNMTNLNESLKVNIETKLSTDYDKLNEFINNEDYKDTSLDLYIDNLNNNKDKIKLSSCEIINFGKNINGIFTISGNQYHGTNETISTNYYTQKISVFSFKRDFLDQNDVAPSDTNQYIFFKIDNIIAYIRADKYFDPVFKTTTDAFPNKYFIINTDGKICYQSSNTSAVQFYDYIKENNNTAFEVENIKKDLINNNDKSLNSFFNIKINNENHILVYSHISNNLSEIPTYVVQLYNQTIVENANKTITSSLLALFSAYVIIICASITLLYMLIMKKNVDIENSRVLQYYDKTYVMHLTSDNRVNNPNIALKTLVSDFKKYRYLSDFTIKENYTDINDAIEHRKPFTIIFEKDNNPIYIRFVVVRNITGKYMIGTDITKEEHDLQEYRQVALYNPVTLLPNSAVLKSVINNKLSMIRTQIEHEEEFEKISLVIVDIENFKSFNNLFSRSIGDLVLNEVSRKISEEIVDYNASLYHLGGDNFAVLFETVTDYEVVRKWCKHIYAIFKRPVDIENNSLLIGLRFGVYNYENEPGIIQNADRIIRNATLALDKIKSYTNSYYSEYNVSIGKFISAEAVLEEDIKNAIDKNEFRMYLQPQYDTEKEAIVGFEALIRWDNPKYKYQSPSHFIEKAEKNNMIIPIGSFVIDETFRLAKLLEKYNIHISINISPVQFLQAGFVNEITEAAIYHDINPSLISIEITETFLMENFQIIVEKMKLLKNKGFSMHLDDFGTGYSSMLYLKELPIDTIKIDKSFINHVSTDKYSRAIVTKIISLAKTLSLEIVAEGVEDEKQNQFLYKNGCNVIQGFLIGQAMPYDKAVELIEACNITKTKKIKSFKK